MRIVRALATFAAQPRGTRRLLSVRFASDFVSMSARPGAVADAEGLADLKDPLVIDVRDPSEVASGKGGPPGKIDGSINVPLNIDGVKQSERPTTQDEFLDNIKKAIDALPKDRPIITHCSSGGRGGKAAEHRCDAGFKPTTAAVPRTSRRRACTRWRSRGSSRPIPLRCPES